MDSSYFPPALQEHDTNHQDGAESSSSRSQSMHHQQLHHDEPQSGHAMTPQHGLFGLMDSYQYPDRLQQSICLLPDAQLSSSATHMPQPAQAYSTDALLQNTTSPNDLEVASTSRQLSVSDWNVSYNDIFEFGTAQDDPSELGPFQSSSSCHSTTSSRGMEDSLPSQQPDAHETILSHSGTFEYAASQDSRSQLGPSQPSFSYHNTSWSSASSFAPSQSGIQQSPVHISQQAISQHLFMQGDDHALGHLPQDVGAQGSTAFSNENQLHQAHDSTASYQGIGTQFPASEPSVPKADKKPGKGAYSLEEERYISATMSAGFTKEEVAAALGRTPQGVYIKWKRMQGKFGDAHASDKRKKACKHGQSPGENQL